ncbi:MAG: tetratricopeptide repeat protein [Betaproteobacteria bacterium]|nr:tetratricopeptide repeat protein [Betaproteobacteria bacterium]
MILRATTLSNLSRVLDSQGKFGDTGSQRAGAKPPAGAKPAAGDDAAQLAARAEAAMRQGQYQEAETLHHQVLATHEKSLGAEHPTTATSVSNLGNVYYLQGRFAEAEKLYRRALQVREKVLGGDHADVATSLNNLANALQELGRDQQLSASEIRARQRAGGGVGATSEIEQMYRRALSIQERTLGRENPASPCASRRASCSRKRCARQRSPTTSCAARCRPTTSRRSCSSTPRWRSSCSTRT